jgi:ribosomal subunit interface protein
MHVDLTARGDIPAAVRRHAEDKIGTLDRYVGSRARRAHVVLSQERNPRVERPAHAVCEIDLTGPIVRGHVDDLDMGHAIDALAEHMERQLRRFVERRLDAQRRPTRRPF